MPRTIHADGRTVTVPDDATPEEINQIFGPAPAAASPVQRASTFGGGMIEGAKDLGQGLMNIPQAALHLGDTFNAMGAQQRALADRASADAKAGHYGNAIWHGVDAMLPGLGPLDAQLTDEYQSGAPGAKSAAMGRTLVNALPSVAGAAADTVLPAAMQKASVGVINKGVLSAPERAFARGANPGRGYLQAGLGPSASMGSIATKAGDALDDVGGKLQDAFTGATSSGKLIPAGDIESKVGNIIGKAKASASGPGVVANTDVYDDLSNSFKPAIAAAKAKGGFTPSELWEMRKNIDQNLNWADQSKLNLTKTQQRVSGAIGGALKDAVPDARPLSQQYQDLTSLRNVANKRALSSSSPLSGLASRAALSGAGALAGESLHGGLGAAVGVGAAQVLDSVPVKTAIATGLSKAPALGRTAALPTGLAAVPADANDQGVGNPNDNQDPDASQKQLEDQGSPTTDEDNPPQQENETKTFAQASVAALPGPVKRVLSSTGLNIQPAQPHMGAQGKPAIASVDPGSPNTINIENQQKFNSSGPQTLGHESVHLWHNNLPPEIQKQIPPDDLKDPYNYGGTQGLQSMRSQGMRLWNLPREKAATVVQYYISQGGENAPKAVKDAYGPWVNDMSQAPLSSVVPSEPDGPMNTTPRAPQGQMYSTQTFAKGDPEPVGQKTGKSQPNTTELAKGSPVRLHTGEEGKVSWLDQKMKIARVKLDSGKQVTAKHSALQVIPHVQVQAHVRRINR